MRKTTSLFFKCVIALQIISASTTYANNFTKEDSLAKSCFYSAKTEIENMLSGKIPLDYERAVFITENAYYSNSIIAERFYFLIDYHTERILQLIANNDNEDKQNFKHNILYSEADQRKMYRELLANWAIYTYLTDTLYQLDGNNVNIYTPFTYSYKDPMGTSNWCNSQVVNLLSEKQGNCYAFVSLFKILSERFHSNANISTASNHIFITHNDLKGTSYNIELASRAFPGSGSIKAITNTTHEAVVSGISMQTLNLKQSISLCLVYLAKGYENKFNSKSDEFILQCAETALKYDSLNLNAMLLKAEVLEERIINENKTIAQLQKDKLFTEYESLIKTLYKKGYREMHTEIKNLLIARMQYDTNAVFFSKDQTPNPFKHIKSDPKDTRYATLSWGLFDEIHETKLYEKYGRALFDTKKQKITTFQAVDTLYNNYNFDPVVFAWQVDPLANQMPNWSPYAAFADNPIMLIDKDGQFPVSVHVEIMKAAMGKYNLPVKVQSSDDVYGMVENGLITGVKNADYFGFAADNHFDNRTDFDKVNKGWMKLNDGLAKKSYNPERSGLGVKMHNVQDFYAHSNYVEQYIEYFKAQGGDISTLKPDDIPTYAEAMKNKEFADNYSKNIKTGTFSIMKWLTGSDKKDPNSHYNMNKDENKGKGAVKVDGAEYTLHEFAVGAATNATIEELGKKVETE